MIYQKKLFIVFIIKLKIFEIFSNLFLNKFASFIK